MNKERIARIIEAENNCYDAIFMLHAELLPQIHKNFRIEGYVYTSLEVWTYIVELLIKKFGSFQGGFGWVNSGFGSDETFEGEVYDLSRLKLVEINGGKHEIA